VPVAPMGRIDSTQTTSQAVFRFIGATGVEQQPATRSGWKHGLSEIDREEVPSSRRRVRGPGPPKGQDSRAPSNAEADIGASGEAVKKNVGTL